MLEQPASEPQMSLHLAGLEQATKSGQRTLEREEEIQRTFSLVPIPCMMNVCARITLPSSHPRDNKEEHGKQLEVCRENAAAFGMGDVLGGQGSLH